MPNIILKIINNEYTNDDCIPNMIHYIYRTKNCMSRKTEQLPIFCYGVRTFPPQYAYLITDFRTVQKSVNASEPYRHLWHLVFSFNCNRITAEMNNWINSIAGTFGLAYPVCYSYHHDTDNPHCHMVISTISYLPDTPPLTDELLSQYISQLKIQYENTDFAFQIDDEGGYLNV